MLSSWLQFLCAYAAEKYLTSYSNVYRCMKTANQTWIIAFFSVTDLCRLYSKSFSLVFFFYCKWLHIKQTAVPYPKLIWRLLLERPSPDLLTLRESLLNSRFQCSRNTVIKTILVSTSKSWLTYLLPKIYFYIYERYVYNFIDLFFINIWMHRIEVGFK